MAWRYQREEAEDVVEALQPDLVRVRVRVRVRARVRVGVRFAARPRT